MSDESRYRVEASDKEDEDERRGLLRPLPPAEELEMKHGVPMVDFLWFRVREDTRDHILMILMPLLVSIIYTAIYASIIIDALPDTSEYMFFLPAAFAIPIGLTAPQLKHALMSSIIAAVFFVIFLVLFLSTPGLLLPEVDLSEFAVSGTILSMVYFIFVLFASILGTFIGVLIREFF